VAPATAFRRIDEFQRRTAIRLAFAYSSLFVIAVLLVFALLYVSLTHSLTNRIRDRVIQARDAMIRVDREQGFGDLTSVVQSEAASVRDADNIFLLLDKTGEVIAGNIRKTPRFAGWRILDRAQFPAISDIGEPEDRFYAIWTTVSQGDLLVGGSDRVITEMSGTLQSALIWGLGLAIVVPALLGAHLARRAQRKIDALVSTLTGVAGGKISLRVPLHEPSDDLDHVALQINQTLDQLQTLIQNVNQTSSDIAHDLKHPIGRLRQKLDDARVNAGSVKEFRDVIREALAEIDIIVETFEALLRITQIEAGAGKNRFAPLDLNGLLCHVADVYGAVIEDEGYRFETAIFPETQAMIFGDRELLTQLFANLIENAIRHTPKDTLISLRLWVDEETVTARLADTGPGIPEDERDKVFQRLYRLEKSRSTPGNGLGLSLVAAIAQLHNARVELSGNNPGLCVTVSFPRLTRAVIGLAVRRDPPVTAASSGGGTIKDTGT
jgi:signal transduction histidine kinase